MESLYLTVKSDDIFSKMFKDLIADLYLQDVGINPIIVITIDEIITKRKNTIADFLDMDEYDLRLLPRVNDEDVKSLLVIQDKIKLIYKEQLVKK